MRWARRTAIGRSRASRASGSRWGRRMYQRGIPATTGHPMRMPLQRRVSLPAFGLTLAFAVLLGMLLYYAQFSGSIRWLLGVVALAVLAAIALGQIQRRTAAPAPLVRPPAPRSHRPVEPRS